MDLPSCRGFVLSRTGQGACFSVIYNTMSTMTNTTLNTRFVYGHKIVFIKIYLRNCSGNCNEIQTIVCLLTNYNYLLLGTEFKI